MNVGSNVQYKVSYQKHLLDVMLGKTTTPKPLAYYGIGVGGSRIAEGADDNYSVQVPDRASNDLFLPIPVKIVNLSTESSSTTVDSDYLGIDEVVIGDATYRLYWYKKLTTSTPYMVSMADASREQIVTLNPDVHTNVAAVGPVRYDILGQDVIPSLMTYVREVIEPSVGYTIPLGISEIGYFANAALDSTAYSDCQTNHILVRHDCTYPLDIPNMATTLSGENEFAMGDNAILTK